MAPFRKLKLENEIWHIIADAFVKGEIKDPRIGFVTVTKVELSKDYAVADVNISVIGSPSETQKTFKGVLSSAGYVQFLVGKNLSLRVTPQIKFHLDETVAAGVEMVGMIERAVAADKKSHSGESEDIKDDSDKDI